MISACVANNSCCRSYALPLEFSVLHSSVLFVVFKDPFVSLGSLLPIKTHYPVHRKIVTCIFYYRVLTDHSSLSLYNSFHKLKWVFVLPNKLKSPNFIWPIFFH